ncbi:haloacid dehalogenase type II [Loktanella sp. R86503]|uniref:haloacid dehalogenase type II n=1 Tax=Loktanella sp. R86503 TaxID=3093847 RepID=UPI0036DD7619
MSNPARPRLIVFDVNETLLDLSTLTPLFTRLFGQAGVLREWFPELILYAQALTLSGRYVPFGDLASGTLRMVGANHDVAITDDDIAELKSLITAMPAYPDVGPALAKLQSAGFTLVTLTNSAPSPSPTPLEKAGIDHFFDRNFSIADLQVYKPHPRTYDMVAQAYGALPQDMCMIACHLWDIIGAQAFGCRGGFLARPHNNTLPVAGLPQPDFIAQDLGDLADQIIRSDSTT